ncbi:MAG: asparagine synthase (glutamine-hydrolyzing) [Promethearchaeota archaeon]
MCGIAGFNFEDKVLLKKMCDIIRYRGPDDEGYYTDSHVSIGMRRLSIIDLQKGHQPQHNENEDIWIVFNGEIFNFKTLRSQLEALGHDFYTYSDTEVIIHAYEEWGDECLNKFRGQFAFCIYDLREKLLFLARDHMGLKPLYYYFDNDLFIFGSEIKAILCCNIKKKIEYKSLDLYLSLRYVPFDSTLFKNIKKIPPSSILKFDLINKTIKVKKYWQIDYKINNNKTESQFARELEKLLEESVNIRLISDVPLGAFLSGGIDSSAIVALMSKYSNNPVKTFSIGFKEGVAIDETKYSNFIANYYNTDHTQIIVDTSFRKEIMELIWHFDDLINDLAMIWVNFMARNAKKKMTVALTGDGADEVFGGYFPEYKMNRYHFLNYVPNFTYKFFMKFYNYIPSHKARIALSYFNLSDSEENLWFRAILHIPDEEKKEILRYNSENIRNQMKEQFINELDYINQIINWDLFYQLPNLYNMKVDKSTMAASLEARVPFLDKEIVKWAATIPTNLKFKGNIEKYILRLALKDILPKEVLKRKKFGFGTPANYWLRTELKELSGEILERLERRSNLINSHYVKKVRKNRINGIYVNRVLNLIMFELWYETFFDNDGLKPISL